MLKKTILFSIFVFFFSYCSVSASGFQIKTIGGLDMDGVTVNHVWYSSNSPVITGITEAYSDVNIDVDSTPDKVTASSDGTWIYHSSLTEGDHTITFTSNGSAITKTITIGNVPADIGALPKAETPTVGNTTPTIILTLTGFFLLLVFPLIKKYSFSS